MVPVSSLGTAIRHLAGADSRIARSVPEDVFLLTPDRVGEQRGYDAERDRNMSHNPLLIDAQHLPAHGGLLVSIRNLSTCLRHRVRVSSERRGLCRRVC